MRHRTAACYVLHQHGNSPTYTCTYLRRPATAARLCLPCRRPFDDFWAGLSLTCMLVFAADIVLRFFVVVEEPSTGRELNRYPDIARHYLK